MLYVSTSQPSQSLFFTLAEYILKVFDPIWIEIKLTPQCYDGATHLLKAIHLSRSCHPLRERSLINVFNRMASMVIGHPENVLLNMMIDERKHIRDLAARRIKVEREADRCHHSSSGDVRKFTIPKLSFEATDNT